MPEPLRWDDPTLRWDTPGLTWDGVTQQQPKTMTQDLLQLDISDTDWADIDAAITVLETKLAAKLTDLTVEQRSRLTKMGPKSETFARQCLVVGRQNANRLPPDTATDLTASEGDLDSFDKLRPRLARLNTIFERAQDSEMALGSDVMVFALSLYGVLKAIGVGAGLDDLRAEIGRRFARGPRATPPPPPGN